MGPTQWRSPLLQYAGLSPEQEQEIQQRRRNVIDKFKASGFNETFTLATVWACKLKWFAGNQPCHGHHGGVLSISQLGTKDHVIAKLSKNSPWRITYESWARCPYTGQTLFERRLIFRDLCKLLESGKTLQHPFDKAFWDISKAENNLAMLVKWYYLASHIVDVTDGNSSGFAKALKLTIQSCILDPPRETRSQAAGVERTGVQQRPLTSKEDSQVSDEGDSETRSGESSDDDDDASTASHASEDGDGDPPASSSHVGLRMQRAGFPVHKLFQAEDKIGFANIDDFVEDSPHRDAPLQAADQEIGRSHASQHPSPSALKMIGKGSYDEPFEIDDEPEQDNEGIVEDDNEGAVEDDNRETLADDTEEALDEHMAHLLSDGEEQLDNLHIRRQSRGTEEASHTNLPRVPRNLIVNTPAVSEESVALGPKYVALSNNRMAGGDLNIRAEVALERCGLLAYSRSVLEGVETSDLEISQKQEGYLPQMLSLGITKATTRIYALLRNTTVDNHPWSSVQATKGEQPEPLQEVEFFAQEHQSDLRLVQGISFPKKYRRILRQPFSLTGWHLDDDLPHELQQEVHEGGNRLRLLCHYLFIVKGVCHWSSVSPGGFESQIKSMFSFMQAQEARLADRLPGPAVEKPSRTHPRVSRNLERQPRCLEQPWERITSRTFYPDQQFQDSGLGSSSSSDSSQYGSSPITHAQVRLNTRKDSKDDLRRRRQSGHFAEQLSPSIDTPEQLSLILSEPAHTKRTGERQLRSGGKSVKDATSGSPNGKKRVAAHMSGTDILFVRQLRSKAAPP